MIATILFREGTYLYGSRYWGLHKYESDWDIAVEDNEENRVWLENLGFVVHDNQKKYLDLITTAITTHPEYPKIQVVLKSSVKDFIKVWKSITRGEYLDNLYKHGLDNIFQDEQSRREFINSKIEEVLGPQTDMSFKYDDSEVI